MAKSRRPKLTPYWHGGVPKLGPGQVILPATVTRARQTLQLGLDIPHDPSRVYVTTDQALARAYAASYSFGPRTGDLYNVKPRGELLADPDYAGLDVSFHCDTAVVIAVLQQGVRMSSTQKVRVNAKYEFWQDGTPRYDPEGYFLPSPELRDVGVTDADMRRFGQWRSYIEVAEAYARAVAAGKLPAVRELRAG